MWLMICAAIRYGKPIGDPQGLIYLFILMALDITAFGCGIAGLFFGGKKKLAFFGLLLSVIPLVSP